MLERQIPRLTGMPAPDFVTCVIGGNDVAWARVLDLEAFTQEIEAIAERPKGAVIGSLPSSCTSPMPGGPGERTA